MILMKTFQSANPLSAGTVSERQDEPAERTISQVDHLVKGEPREAAKQNDEKRRLIQMRTKHVLQSSNKENKDLCRNFCTRESKKGYQELIVRGGNQRNLEVHDELLGLTGKIQCDKSHDCVTSDHTYCHCGYILLGPRDEVLQRVKETLLNMLQSSKLRPSSSNDIFHLDERLGEVKTCKRTNVRNDISEMRRTSYTTQMFQLVTMVTHGVKTNELAKHNIGEENVVELGQKKRSRTPGCRKCFLRKQGTKERMSSGKVWEEGQTFKKQNNIPNSILRTEGGARIYRQLQYGAEQQQHTTQWIWADGICKVKVKPNPEKMTLGGSHQKDTDGVSLINRQKKLIQSFCWTSEQKIAADIARSLHVVCFESCARSAPRDRMRNSLKQFSSLERELWTPTA